MRWKIPPEPKTGDVRHIKKFAWTPVYAYDEGGNLWKIWLEHYLIQEKYGEGMCMVGGNLFHADRWNFVKRWVILPTYGDYVL